MAPKEEKKSGGQRLHVLVRLVNVRSYGRSSRDDGFHSVFANECMTVGHDGPHLA
jgi:hypothetical protein